MDTLVLFPITHTFFVPSSLQQATDDLASLVSNKFQGKISNSGLFNSDILDPTRYVCVCVCMWTSSPSMIDGTMLFFLREIQKST